MSSTFMHLSRRLLILVGILCLSACLGAQEQDSASGGESGSDATEKSLAERTKGLARTDGFMPFYWDAQEGAVLVEIEDFEHEFLYVHSLATGLGSNPVGLDRGQLGDEKVVRFERVGPKVLLIERNLRFRAGSDNVLEQRAVRQSFAESVLWGGTIEAEEDGKVLVDITSLLLSDVHGVTQTLSAMEQGSYQLDDDRSAVYLPRCKGFPDNTEFEATLTFSGDEPGRYVQQTAPTPQAVTLRQHHSLVRLPDANYQPRKYDVRSPSIFMTFADYASPLDAALQQRWITRHRLQKQDPDAALSEAVEPIVYYVDAGAPAQIQQALLEGASWWNEAFESAGFKDAFQVKLLPPEADPLDVRYNVIQWVHRSTRGWSYGGSVIDPRTGEIIKGHVTLGSLRVRQDQLLFQGLQSTAGAKSACACCGMVGLPEEATFVSLANANPLEVALARIRQLSAHEVGHTLGFVHNFAASTYADRASVMDYPAPRVKLVDGKLDLSDAYGVGIGAWDKVSVKYAYSEFKEGQDEDVELDKILKEAKNQGMLFLSDADARPQYAAHPKANLWDNGTDPLVELAHVMEVRRIALANFDPNQLPSDITTADIAQYFTPIYLHHRYQLNAVGKLVGGQDYEYGKIGAKPSANQPIDLEIQSQAIDALVSTLHPDVLVIPKNIQEMISPRPYSTIRDEEILPGQSGRIFDPLAAARVAADLTLNELFAPQRLARLAVHGRAQEEFVPEVFIPALATRISNQCPAEFESFERYQIGQVVREALLERLITIVDDSRVSVQVRSGSLAAIRNIAERRARSNLRVEVHFTNLLQRRANQVLDRVFDAPPKLQPLDTPPGSPIGTR